MDHRSRNISQVILFLHFVRKETTAYSARVKNAIEKEKLFLQCFNQALLVCRYLCVSRPLQANTVGMRRTMQYLVALVWVGSVVYNLPRYFFLDVVYNKSRDIYLVRLNNFGNSDGFKYVYNTALFFLVNFLIPLIIMAFSTHKLVRHMKKIHKKRAHLTSKAVQENDMNKSLIFIVLFFTVFTLAIPINSLLRNVIFSKEKVACPHAPYFFARLTPTMVFLNSSVNFSIYVLCSRHFRSKFLARFGCKQNAVTPSSGSGSSDMSLRQRNTVSTVAQN